MEYLYVLIGVSILFILIRIKQNLYTVTKNQVEIAKILKETQIITKQNKEDGT